MTFESQPSGTGNLHLKRKYSPAGPAQPPDAPRPQAPKPKRMKSPGEMQLEALAPRRI